MAITSSNSACAVSSPDASLQTHSAYVAQPSLSQMLPARRAHRVAEPLVSEFVGDGGLACETRVHRLGLRLQRVADAVVVDDRPEELNGYGPNEAFEDVDHLRGSLALQPEMIYVFEDAFGPYPFNSYGSIVDDDSVGYALETQTRPVYSRVARESTVAHELAHQWFGNAVSPERWQDIWLNEGWATYAEWVWTEAAGGAGAQTRFEDVMAIPATTRSGSGRGSGAARTLPRRGLRPGCGDAARAAGQGRR